jgi:hypothetical protein
MRARATRLAIRGGSRLLAAALLIVLMLTPICSSICQAQSCQQPQAAAKDSGCHHAESMGSDGSAALMAASLSCGARELWFALPEVTDTLRVSRATSAAPNADSWTAVTAISLPQSMPTHFSRTSGPALLQRTGATDRFFDSFTILRI